MKTIIARDMLKRPFRRPLTQHNGRSRQGLQGKVAVVTGGGLCTGRALVLAAEGCKVANLRAPTPARRYARRRDAGVRGPTDQRSPASQGGGRLRRELGPIWALVNNAGWDPACALLS